MKYLIAFLLSVSLPALSAPQHNITFEAKENLPEVSVRWAVVDNVDEVCRFYGVQTHRNIAACSIYDGKKCLIITARRLDMAVLGHELRHCFEGRWHN
jgi:hemolysin-activating ACP:hemolysin acyltransferase